MKVTDRVTKRVLNLEVLNLMSVFSKVTRINAKDCIEMNGRLTFIVDESMAGKAIGKKGINVKILERELKKKIKVVEFNSNTIEFIRNLVYPNKINEITEENNIYTIMPADSMSRSMLIGRNAVNLRGYESIVRRFFNVTELKVK